jgi:hypothetical protein
MVLTFTFLVLAIHSVVSQDPVVDNDVANNGGGKKDIPMELYNKAYSYLRTSEAFKNFTLEETIRFINDLSDWKAPRELKEKFPYYLSGYDYEDQPVWIGEVGKYDVRAQIEKGQEATHNLTQYLFQACFRMLESMIVKDTPTREVRNIFGIADWEGFDITQGTHAGTVRYVLHMLQTYSDFLGLGLGHAVIINANYLTTVGFESIKPVLGGAFDRLEILGTNKAKWQKVLKKLLPENVIPTWYGGSKDYKPVAVYG